MQSKTTEAAPTTKSALLSVEQLKMYFPIRAGFSRRVKGHVRAVDDVNFAVASGETLGLVGESGCGKTTIGRCILRAYDPTGGQILYENAHGERVDLASLRGTALKPYRRELRMIFQDPYSSLNPRLTVLDTVAERCAFMGGAGQGTQSRLGAASQGRAAPEPRRYPRLSGGRHASGSPARWPSIRAWSCATRPFPPWMFPCRRRS
jgi:ABC-type glutathione transport system ATPase component